MSLKYIETPVLTQKIKLAQSFDEIPEQSNNTIKKQSQKTSLLNSTLSNCAPKLLKDLKSELKGLKIYHPKLKQDSVSRLREKALSLIDQNNQLNSVLESDIALQYLETQDISPKHDNRSLAKSKREMIHANVELNKKLFQRFFLDDYPEKTDPVRALEKLSQQLNLLNSRHFVNDKENLDILKNSNSFIEVQSANFNEAHNNSNTHSSDNYNKNINDLSLEKLKDDYKALNGENLFLKQENHELKSKIGRLVEDGNGLKRANSILLNELEVLDKELKISKDSLLLKSVENENTKNEEFKLLDEKITQLLNENEILRQKNSEQERNLEILLKEIKNSHVNISQNIEKSGQFSLDLKKISYDKENQNFSESLKEINHAKCNKIIEDLKNELMEAHLCIADLENKIKSYWTKTGKRSHYVIKKYDVSLNVTQENNK